MLSCGVCLSVAFVHCIEAAKDTAIATIIVECKSETVSKLSIGAISCYLLLVVDGRRSSVNFNCPILCLGDS